MSVKCSDISAYMNEIAPEASAEEWDNAGFLVGDPDREVAKILVCLDVTSGVILEAAGKNVDMIVSHHPFIFKGIKRIVTSDVLGRNIFKLIENGISVYSSHTNLDIAEGGVNETLARCAGIKEYKLLEITETEAMYKIVAYVPKGHEEAVKNALFNNGAGGIGKYDCCSFSASGTGSFRPLNGSRPYLGIEGHLEQTEELRVETIVPEKDLDRAVSAMKEAHPYEEPAYDIFRLDLPGKQKGFGLVGNLESPKDFSDFLEGIKASLGVSVLRVAGSPVSGTVSKAAVYCGSFGLDLKLLAASGGDVLVTGDMKHHDAVDAIQMGLCIVDAGHYNTEAIILPVLARLLQEKFGKEIEVEVSNVGEGPFRYL